MIRIVSCLLVLMMYPVSLGQEVNQPSSGQLSVRFKRGEPGSLTDRWFEFNKQLGYWGSLSVPPPNLSSKKKNFFAN